MRLRPGLNVSIRVLGTITLVLVAGAFVSFILFTATSEGTEDTDDAVDETGQELESRLGDLRDAVTDSLTEAEEEGGMPDIDAGNGGTGGNGGPTNGDSPGDGTDDDSDNGNGDDTDNDRLDEVADDPSSDTYNIFFGPDETGGSDYADSSEFDQRVDRYMSGLMEYTPFGECPDQVSYEMIDDPHDTAQSNAGAELPDDQADAHVVIAEEEDCGTDGPGPYAFPSSSRVVMFDGLPSEVGQITFAHEMGHLFNMCDEYGLSIWEDQDSDFSTGCLNEWPRDDGLWWQGTMFDQTGNQMDDACQMHSAEDPHELEGEDDEGYCGREVDGAANIMGNSWDVPDTNSCPTGLLVDVDIHPDTYDAWMELINEQEGVECG